MSVGWTGVLSALQLVLPGQIDQKKKKNWSVTEEEMNELNNILFHVYDGLKFDSLESEHSERNRKSGIKILQMHYMVKIHLCILYL